MKIKITVDIPYGKECKECEHLIRNRWRCGLFGGDLSLSDKRDKEGSRLMEKGRRCLNACKKQKEINERNSKA